MLLPRAFPQWTELAAVLAASWILYGEHIMKALKFFTNPERHNMPALWAWDKICSIRVLVRRFGGESWNGQANSLQLIIYKKKYFSDDQDSSCPNLEDLKDELVVNARDWSGQYIGFCTQIASVHLGDASIDPIATSSGQLLRVWAAWSQVTEASYMPVHSPPY